MAYPTLFNFKVKFDPNTLPGYPETGTYVLEYITTRSRNDPFRLYIPKGATRVNYRLCSTQGGKIGAAIRIGWHSRCLYTIVPSEYYDLPWGPYNGTSVVALDGLDFQGRNMGGQIVILSSSSTPANYLGEWVYTKVLRFDSAELSLIQFEVTVDAAKYKTWYTDFGGWDAKGNPIEQFSGGTCGYCSDEWGTPQPDCPVQGDFVPFMIII